MKVVLLSGYDPTAKFLHRHLGSRHDVRLLRVVWPEPAPQRRSLLKRLNALIDPVRLANRVTRLDVDAHYARLHARLESLLLGSETPPPPRVDGEAPTTTAPAVRGPAGAAELAKLQPDVVIVDGAPIIGNELLAVPRLATINVHFGIAPEYRGSHTLFWAMYRRDWAHLGVTLHHVSSVLDGGRVLARLYPELRADDDEAAVMARCTRLAATALDELLIELAHGTTVPGVPQGDGGRCYRSRERDAVRDALLRGRLALGDGPVPRPERIERYWTARA